MQAKGTCAGAYTRGRKILGRRRPWWRARRGAVGARPCCARACRRRPLVLSAERTGAVSPVSIPTCRVVSCRVPHPGKLNQSVDADCESHQNLTGGLESINQATGGHVFHLDLLHLSAQQALRSIRSTSSDLIADLKSSFN